MGLTNTELQYMRDAIGQLMPDVCNILSVTNTPDGYGGVTQTWGTASANVKCRLDVKSGNIATTGGAIQEYVSYMLSLPYDTVIDFTNQVEINGSTYAVTDVNDNQSWNAVKRVSLEWVA